MKIEIGTYSNDPTFAGWIEPSDKSWIVFVRHDGGHDYFGAREASGAAIG